MVWVCIPTHNPPLQLILPRFVPLVLALSRNTTLPQQISCLILLHHHQRQLTIRGTSVYSGHTGASPPSWMTTSSRFFWTCLPSPTRLTCCLFPPFMQHHDWLSLVQRALVSILTLPNSRLPLIGGLALRFRMVLAAH